MFAGPIIARELLTAPRPPRYYAARASYAGGLLIVMLTVWQVLVGWDEGNAISILSRFGAILFSFFAYLQLTLMLFFAPIASATAVAHEKDRRTFILLLMTDLQNVEIVVGKLVASLLQILTLLLTSLPVFSLCLLLGGVSFGQVIDVFLVTFAAGLFGGTLGMIVALWRDRTFQSIALTVLLVVLVLILGEAVARILPEGSLLATAIGPFQAIGEAIRPRPDRLVGPLSATSLVFTGIYLAGSALIVLACIARLRVWNPGKNEPREQREGEAEVVEQLYEVDDVEVARPEPAVVGAVISAHVAEARGDLPDASAHLRENIGEVGELAGDTGSANDVEPDPVARRETTGLHVPRRTHRRVVRKVQSYREVWTNPILWRELRTRAYGTKPLIIKGAYVLAFVLGVAAYFLGVSPESGPWDGAKAAIPALLAVLSLILINAQGVTALTSERDTGALDLLLVTELSPQQFIYGKLYGALYNAKEMVGATDRAGHIALGDGIYSGRFVDLHADQLRGPGPLLGNAWPARGDHVCEQPAGGGEQSGHHFLSNAGNSFLCRLDHSEPARIRPAAAELPDLHWCGERGTLQFARREEPVAGHRAGRAPHPLLELLLHHQYPSGRFRGGVPGQPRGLFVRPAVDADSRSQ